ncbi:helix-turn-helix domain-containing protein [Gorillibacterium sp. sgz5001074]|uniref:helix-turn-helix domain-containing protein n=1 Tax=Gorillibacterium sp. sgz5001074 TaxID=3446695 RepID=UPI003F6618C0
MKNIGFRIKATRLEKNISLSELAEAAGVAKSYLSNVERGIQSNPSIQVIEKIAVSLQVPIHYLLFGQQNEAALDPKWLDLIRDAISSGIDIQELQEYVAFLKWKKNRPSH